MSITKVGQPITVAVLRDLLGAFPDDWPITSHNGRCWTDNIRVRVASTTDPERPDDAPEYSVAIAGGGTGQDIWPD